MCSRTRATPSLVAGALLFLSALEAGTLTAQSHGPDGALISPGARVRLTQPGSGRLVGTVVALSRDTLVARWDEGITAAIPLAGVTGLDVSVGRRSHARRGARLGLLGGIVIGTAIGLSSNEVPAGCEPGSGDGLDGLCRGLTEAKNVFVECFSAGILGGLGGLAVGALLRTEVWAPAAVGPGPRQVGLSVSASARGRAIALALSF